MANPLQLEISPQPDNTTCGPTCLHAVYRYFDDAITLEQVIREAPKLEEGGTLAVLLGCHALERGYRATIYTYNLNVFDPTWFVPAGSGRAPKSVEEGRATKSFGGEGGAKMADLVERLRAQMGAKESPKLHAASRAYIDFLTLGGTLHMQDLSATLVRRYLKRSIPILTGLSATYLYFCAREFGPGGESDDVRGLPAGHFVVLCGYDKQRRTVQVADPYMPNPLGLAHYYEVGLDRLLCAVLLGVLTYDANLLIIEPGRGSSWRPGSPVHSHQRI